MFYQLVTVNHILVKRYTSIAVASTAKYEVISMLIRKYGGLPVIVALLKHPSVRYDEKTMAAVTSAVFALANINENREELVELKTMAFMMGLLEHSNEDVLSNAVGTISELLKVKTTIKSFIDQNGKLSNRIRKVFNVQ